MKNIDSVNKNEYSSLGPKIFVTQGQGKKAVSLLSAGKRSRTKGILSFLLKIIIAAILVLGAILVSRAADLSNKIFVGQKTSFFQKLKSIVSNGDEAKLIGEDLGQINILLLGIGGEGHDGPYLTDTIMLAQIRPDLGQVVLTSIPRDYLVSLPANLGQRKLNAAFAEGFAREKDWNEAGRFARQAVEGISGLTIPYFTVVDFKGFEKAINQVGGLDIYVERTFTDYQFPDDRLVGFLPPVTFTQGQQHFDGKQALQFARSRHAAGPEGSDFARSARQQKILQAFKDKVTNLNLVTDARKINSLMSIFADHFHTNISPAEAYRINNLIKTKDFNDFTSLSLDPSSSLICPKILEDSGAYVLVPCAGKTAEDVKNYFKNSFTLGKIYGEKSVVWMANSTKDKNLYKEAGLKLQDAGLTVWEVPYTRQAFPQNIFYQVNPKPATAEFLKNTLNATEVTLPPPEFKIDKSKVDIIVILGESQ